MPDEWVALTKTVITDQSISTAPTQHISQIGKGHRIKTVLEDCELNYWHTTF